MKLISLGVALAATSLRTTTAASSGLPVPPLPPWYPLQAWEISSVSTSHPSASAYGPNASTLLLTITNPRYIAALPAPHASGGGYVAFTQSTAQCELHWKVDEQTPYGHSANSCVAAIAQPDGFTHAQWDITLNELHTDLAGPGDYYLSLSFSLAYNGTLYGTTAYKLMTGGTSFRAGENLDGQCAEGHCEYQLRDGSAPALLQPTLQECKSACG
ncbi:hypothetical protein F5Y14DRAFT_277006 [Nemania sp. NC0429]|nr:hypothetical protein F5Y14DRAFT_277006 [Nemania sp. NC0429]